MIELAFTTPLLLLLLAGILNYAMFLRVAICMADAARAGAEYGSQNPDAAQDLAGMQRLAIYSEPTVPGMSATAVNFCQCAGVETACSAACGTGLQVYVKVTATADCPPVFAYARLHYSRTVGASAIMRAQ